MKNGTFNLKSRISKQAQIVLLLMSFLFVFTTSCNKDENEPPLNENTWTELGSLNANGTISVLCSDGSNIYAAGRFTNSNGKYYVAKWNGSTWSELGSLNTSESICALWADPDGTIYADALYQSGPTWYRYVAKWDGSNWSNFGNLNVNSAIYTIFSDGVGNVYAGGKFTNNDGKPYVAKWNGSSWSEVGNLNANGYINVVRADPTGKIFAGGDFKDIDGKCYVALWDGSNWQNSGMLTEHATGESANALSRDNSGNFYAGGSFKHPGQNQGNRDTYLAKWSNGVQSIVPGSEVNDHILTLTDGSIIYAAGSFTNSSGKQYVAKWDGTTWSELGSLKANNRILSLCTDTAGNVYAAGEFTNSNNVSYVAIYMK